MIKGKITLSGKSGTGKTSVGKLLASKLGYELVSVGKFSREFAKSKYGMSIDEFQVYATYKNQQITSDSSVPPSEMVKGWELSFSIASAKRSKFR